MAADRFEDHALRFENKTERHNFASLKLKKVVETCGYKVLTKQGALIYETVRHVPCSRIIPVSATGSAAQK